jgi:hypothetical protein
VSGRTRLPYVGGAGLHPTFGGFESLVAAGTPSAGEETEIVRALGRSAHPIHALDEPPTLLLPPLGDVNDDATQPRRAVAFSHHDHQVAQSLHPAVRSDHAAFENVVALLAGRRFAEGHPLAIFRVKMILPECRLGQPALHRIAQDAFGLVAHERELKGRRLSFPDDSLDRS